MKKFILGAILLFSVLGFSQNLKKLDEKNGFRQYKFGMSVDSIPNLKLIETSKNGFSKYYDKTDEVKKIGDFNVDRIVYGFYKDKLDIVMIYIKSYGNSKGILGVFETQYGKGYQANRYMEDYTWFGKTITLSYDENSLTNDSKIFIYTNQFTSEKAEDKKISEEKAKNEI
jgi:hypothetical protein